MAKTLIIGYGNPLRGDDGLGWYAAQRLAAVLQEQEAQIMACHQLTPELAEPISQADRVVFIDAAQQEPAGKLFCQRLTPEASLPCILSHHLTPLMLLVWTQGLYGTCPEAMVLSVSSQSFGYGAELSPAVAAALPELIERCCTLVLDSNTRGVNRPALPGLTGDAEPDHA
jgi:hydrogenase maturation protease